MEKRCDRNKTFLSASFDRATAWQRCPPRQSWQSWRCFLNLKALPIITIVTFANLVSPIIIPDWFIKGKYRGKKSGRKKKRRIIPRSLFLVFIHDIAVISVIPFNIYHFSLLFSAVLLNYYYYYYALFLFFLSEKKKHYLEFSWNSSRRTGSSYTLSANCNHV